MGSLRFVFKIFFGIVLLGSAAARAATAGPQASTTVSIASASNLVYAIEELNAAFRAIAPDVTVVVATGASGNLVTQIVHGGPYDVFLSADLESARALIAKGRAEKESLIVFATGRLVLWSTRTELRLEPLATAVTSASLRKLAIANPVSAPYGRAAKQALEALGAWPGVEGKIVAGENITQTAQFVETGNADAGFVALSLVLAPRLKGRGHWVPVPAALYSPLEHGAVLTPRGAENPAARRYLAFLQTTAARQVLERFGYDVPK